MGVGAVSICVARADARHLPLPDGSVDLIVTSPPFYSLRDYGAGDGEIGAEPTPSEFLEALWAATREMVRVLKPDGSIWVNLGDLYADRANAGASAIQGSSDGALSRADRPGRPQRFGVRRKSLYGLPWAYALGCSGILGALAAEQVHRAL
jgi:SAM-dependent methyltransferase